MTAMANAHALVVGIGVGYQQVRPLPPTGTIASKYRTASPTGTSRRWGTSRRGKTRAQSRTRRGPRRRPPDPGSGTARARPPRGRWSEYERLQIVACPQIVRIGTGQPLLGPSELDVVEQSAAASPHRH